ncbi:hypothetical protein CVT24_004429 [Panaeolus cyanescens]|uniref:Fork-head domain-containing protein n=1 Tax=Panaeolus cyanescens TaxID=181874 RepID=A0A409VDA4_9AGAR|nr:hypothetical protein CVT24_004429 [Panaeolus cyanescens]
MEDLPTLQSLADESPRGTKPVYSWLTLTKCAIAGSPNKTLSAEEVIQAIQDRFIFFTFERAGDWKTYIINTLSNTPCFSPTGTGVFSPDELYWEYDHTLDKDRENAVFSYVPSPGPSSRSGSVGPFSNSATGGSGASTPQHGGSSAGASGSRPSPSDQERSRRRRHEDRHRRRHAKDKNRAAGRVTEALDGEGERGSEREGGRERHRERSRTRERPRTREQDAPPSRDGSVQPATVPRPRTKSNPTRPPPLSFGSSSNLRPFVVGDSQHAAAHVHAGHSHYQGALQCAQDDGQELPMPPRLGHEADPDTGSLRSFRSFRSLIDAASGAVNGTRDRSRAWDQAECSGTPIAIALPSSSEPPQTEQQRRKMEKEQDKARKKMEKQRKKEAEARKKAEEKEMERVAKLERDRVKATTIADRLKTMTRGPSHSGSNPSSASGYVSASNSFSLQGHSGPAGRGTPQPDVPQRNLPYVLNLLDSAPNEIPHDILPIPPKNGQEGTLKKAKSFLLFWKG